MTGDAFFFFLPDFLMLSCAKLCDKSVAPSPSDGVSMSWMAFLRPDRREAKKSSKVASTFVIAKTSHHSRA